MKLSDRYDIWLTFYNTYDEVEAFGDRKSAIVMANLSYETALKKLTELGFGYCAKPVVP